MTASAGNKLISIQPAELKFIFEFKKQSYCDLKVYNKTEHYVAFKVKTTSPKKYFVRPNTGLIQPWDSCIIRVTLQASRECPLDMECKDKFLFQSAIVPPHTYVHELPQNTFNKESGKRIEECKLKVSYISPPSPPQSSFESEVTNGNGLGSKTISHLKEERDAATKKTKQLQRELEMLKRQIDERNEQRCTLKIAALVGLIGIILGFILKLSLSPRPHNQA